MKSRSMKLLLVRKFIWVILFSLVHLWFMVFNWQLFITVLNVNLGFGVVRLPPFLVLFLAGFVMLLIQSWSGYVNKLHRIIHDLEEELEEGNEYLQSSQPQKDSAEQGDRKEENRSGPDPMDPIP